VNRKKTSREAILRAAVSVMLEHGPGVDVKCITDAALIGKGTLYLYFTTKAELIQAVRESILAEVESVICGPSAFLKEQAAARLHLLLEISLLHRAEFSKAFVDSWLFTESWQKLVEANAAGKVAQ
jgi:AcrR family transcriptional regulator